MADTGTLYPGTVTTAAVVPYDDLNWTNPGNISADDTNYAYITENSFDTGAQSYVMYAQKYGATVGTAGSITGVQVEIGRYYATQAVRDGVVQLINGAGTPIGDNLGSLTTSWPTSIGTMVYGGSANLWGATLTPAIVNSDAFGVRFVGSAAGQNSDAYVDFIRMVVFYSEPVTQWNVTPAEAAHAQTSDAAGITATYSITAAEAAHVQAADAASLTLFYPTYDVTPGAAAQAQASDTASISLLSSYAPQTGILDAFNRADENPLSGWGNAFAVDQGGWKIVSNQAVPAV